MKTNVEKLQDWCKEQIEKHGLRAGHVWGSPSWNKLTEEERAGELLKMINAPVVDDKELL